MFKCKHNCITFIFFYKKVIFWLQPQNFFKNPKLSLKNFLFTIFYKPQAFLIFLEFQKNWTNIAKFEKIWTKMASFMSYCPEPGWNSFLFFLYLVVILNDTISQPGQFPYFFLNFGPLPASVSYKTLSYKKWVYCNK